MPYRFTRERLRDEPPPFDARPTELKLETTNSFGAVPQSKFKDMDTMIQPDTFVNYIESSHDSERDMLRNVEMIVDMGPSTLVDILIMEMHLECNNLPTGTPAASDDSVIRLSCIYGWIISLKDKTRIVSCRGKAYGFHIEPRRMGCGRFCSLLFIIRLFEFDDQNPSNILSLVCDTALSQHSEQDRRQTTETVPK